LSWEQAQHGAVVSDAGEDAAVRGESVPSRRGSRHAANPGNQRFFAKQHEATTIADAAHLMPGSQREPQNQ
jgi:hypothetical protein